jgi:hypothetical protein
MLRAKRVDRPLSPRAQASRLIAALAALFAEWVVLEQVRSVPVLSGVFRFADALAVYVGAEGWTVHGFDAKRSRNDWTRELAHPEKSAPFRLFCTQWSLVVPAPWKHVVLTLDELPDRWGLIEVDGGTARVVVEALAHDPGPLPVEVIAALFTAAASRGAVDAQREDEAPLREITRPRLSFGSVGLACGHVVPRPMDKVLPRSVACLACAAELPVDVEVLEAGLRDASAEDLDRLAPIFDARRAARGAA